MIQYNYVENERMHSLISDMETILTAVKAHWKTDNIPFQLIKNGKITIDMEGFDELKAVNVQVSINNSNEKDLYIPSNSYRNLRW